MSRRNFKAIRKLLGGGRYVSPTLAERLAMELGANAEGAVPEKLSDREFEVLRMIALGKTTSHVAEELHLSAQLSALVAPAFRRKWT